MATENIDIVVTERGATEASRDILQIGTSAQRTGGFLKQLQADLNNNARATLLNATASQNLTSQLRTQNQVNQQLVGGMQQLTSAYQAQAAAAGNAANQTQRAGQAAQAATGSFSSFRNVLATVTAGFGLRQLVDLLSRYQDLDNKLQLVTKSSSELKAVQEELLKIANQNRVGYETLANSFFKVAQSTKDLGLSQRQTLQFTDALTKSLRISGASAQETASVLLQIPQALSSGELKGDELRSFLENNSRGVDILAKALGVARGELKDLGSEGKISAKAVVDAFIGALPQLNAEFAKTTPTIAQSFQVLGNAAAQYAVELDKAVGFSSALSQAALGLANNFSTFAPVLLVAGAGMAALLSAAGGLTGVLSGVGVALATVGRFLLLNPFGILLTAIAGTIFYLVQFGDQIRIAGTSFATFADAAGVVWEDIKAGLQSLLDFISPAIESLKSMFNSVVEPIKSAFASAFEGIDLSWIGVVRAIASGLDTVVGAFRAAGSVIIAAWRTVPAAIAELILNGMNAVIESVEGALNKISGAINAVFGKLGVSVGSANLGRITNSFKGAGETFGKAVQEGVREGFNFNTFRTYVDGVVDRADKSAKQRLQTSFRQSEIAEVNRNKLLDTPRGPAAKPKPDEAGGGGKKGGSGNSLADDLKELQDKVSPALKALREFNEAKDTLDKSLAAGLINQQQYNELLEKTGVKYRDLIDPLGKINRDLDEEMKLLTLSNREREVQNRLMELEKQLREKGIQLAPQERAALEERVRGIQQFKETASFIDEAFSTAFKGIESAIGELVTKGKINFSDLVRSMLADLAKLSAKQFITKPLEGLLSSVTKGFFGGSGGGLSSLFGGAGGGAGAPLDLSSFLKPFAEGGDFSVGGAGGIDSQLVAFRATPGERVSVSKPGDASAKQRPTQVVFNIQTPDANSFKQSQSQISAAALRALRMGARNN